MKWLTPIALALASSSALAQAPSFEGTGQAPIVNGDRVRARTRALDDAFRQAIDQAAASLFDAPALAQRQSALKLAVEPKAKSYVTGYRVLDEHEEGGAFRVHVSADVALDRLERDLGAPLAAAGAPEARVPRIGVLIVERGLEGEAGAAHGPRGGPDRKERALAALVAAGVAPVSLAEAGDATDPSAGYGPPRAAAAARAIRTAKLDGALYAQIAAAAAGPVRGTSFTAQHARGRLDLVDIAGRLLWSAEAEADDYAANATLAAQSAANHCFDDLIARLGPALGKQWPQSATITVRVERLDRYADLGALERVLAAVQGVTAVEPRRFVGGGGAELAVRGPSDTAALLTVLAKRPASPGAPRFEALAIDAHTIAVRIVPPPPAPPTPTDPSAATPAPNGASTLPPTPRGTALPGPPR